MTTVVFPTLAKGPTQCKFGQRSNVMQHTSPLSANVQTVELPGARWTVSMNFVDLPDPDKSLLDAFLAQLRGQANRAQLYDLASPLPRGTMQGTMTTSGAISAGATSATITAGSGQAAKTLLTGDKLNIGGELKMVVADATANGSGVITVTVEPPFRAAISNGASVVWQNPTSLFLLQSNTWNRSTAAPNWSSYSLDFAEVW